MFNVIFYNLNEASSPSIDLNNSYFASISNGLSFKSEVVINDNNIQFPSLTSSVGLFSQKTLPETFNISLPALVTEQDTFLNCFDLVNINFNAPFLTTANKTFYGCEYLQKGTINCPNLKSGRELFYNCYSLDMISGIGETAFGGNYQGSELKLSMPLLQDGTNMFSGCQGLTAFDYPLKNLIIGDNMFAGCWLKYIDTDLSSLRSASGMFGGSRGGCQIQFFDIPLPSLVTANNMFRNSQILKFSSKMPTLKSAQLMFSSCYALNQFNSDLSNLVYGRQMFEECNSLKQFICDVPNLVDARGMFYGTNLEQFQGSLSSLLSGSMMFYGCKLSPESILYIVDNINDLTPFIEKINNKDVRMLDNVSYMANYPFHGLCTSDTGSYPDSYIINTLLSKNTVTFPAAITLGINVTNDQATIADQLQTFAEEAGFDTWQELKQEFTNKGWTATFQYGGTDTSVTLSQDEKFRGVPVYARIEEVLPAGETLTEQEKEIAEYCTEDGTRYFNIDWGHDVNDYDKFQHFGSLLEACGYFGVIPKKYLQEVTES